MKCSGCDKEVSDDHPLAVVTCIDCALEESRATRVAYWERAVKMGRSDDNKEGCGG